MIQIIPAIMPDSFEDLEHKVSLVASEAKLVQIDVMDGKFVKSRSWPYFSGDEHSFDALLNEKTGLPEWEKVDYEIDLMVSKPEEVVDEWITAGATRLIIHIESTEKMLEVITTIDGRTEIGIALNPDTPIADIVGYLEDIDFVQFMGISKIGYQGESFDERVFDKIREFHNAHPEIKISVDGGVNMDNAKALIEEGVTRLVSGSVIFDTGNPAAALEEFKKMLE